MGILTTECIIYEKETLERFFMTITQVLKYDTEKLEFYLLNDIYFTDESSYLL